MRLIMKFKAVRSTVIVALITLLACEIALRVSGTQETYSERASGNYISPYHQTFPSWYFTEKPNSEFTDVRGEFSYHYILDSLGLLRDDALPADSADIKILVLGDSFTFGIGAPQDSSWTRILQRELQEKCSRQVKVFNGAKQGGDPFFSLVLYRDKLHLLKPDILLFLPNSSDILEVFARGGYERFKSDGTVQTKPPPWHEPLFQYSHLIRAYLKIFRGVRSEYLYRDKNYESISQNTIIEINACLAEMKKTSEANGTQFIVAPMPLPYEIKSGAENRLLNYNGKPDFVYGDVDSALRDFFRREAISTYYWQIDGHFNSRGYQVLSGAIFNLLVKKSPLLIENCRK